MLLNYCERQNYQRPFESLQCIIIMIHLKFTASENQEWQRENQILIYHHNNFR